MIKLLKYSLFTLIIFSSVSSAQDYKIPQRVRKLKEYKEQCKRDSNNTMIELRKMIPGIVYDLRYATENNFMHRYMYPANTSITFLRLPAALALKKVQEELRPKGYGLKIFDAYRPWSVTAKFWELVKDERYVANPSKGSGHNRGIAVDLTIIELVSGKELDMGTGFDNFTDSAHHIFTQLPAKTLENRKLLKTLMESAGFKALESEWWHYSLPDAGRYEIMDIPFNKIKKAL